MWNADINFLNDAGETPFIIAIREGKLDMMRMYINEFEG